MLTLELDYEFAFEVNRLSKEFYFHKKEIDELERRTRKAHFNIINWVRYTLLLKEYYPNLCKAGDGNSPSYINAALRNDDPLNEKQEAIVGLFLASIGRDPSKWANVLTFDDDDNLWE